MAMPNIPNITPNITVNREQVINLLLASVALEELSLAHIVNAEGEKVQAVVACKPCKMDDLIIIDKEIGRTMRDVIKNEMLLQFKLEEILELIDCKEKCCDDEN